MSRSVYAIAAVVLAAGTTGAVAHARNDEPKPATVSSPPTVSAPSTSHSNVNADTPAGVAVQKSAAPADTAPKIVVRQNAAAGNEGDARVQVGAMKISMASWASGQPGGATGSELARTDAPAATGGAITIPANTLGPGEPYWRTQERASAEQRLAEARVDLVSAEAQHAARQAGRDRGYTFFGNSYFSHGGYRLYGGLRGPVTTTTTTFDTLGSTAQRAFAEAAYPRLNGSTEARDAIVRQFGRDAAPPIVRIQNDVDAIHRKANSERPK